MEKFKYIDPVYVGPVYFEGILKKLKSENSVSKFFSKFNKRFFAVDLQEYSIWYKKNKNSKVIRKFSLFDLDYIDTEPKSQVKCDWKFSFSFKISNRIFILHSDSHEQYKTWCGILKCCIKPKESEVFYASFPSNEKKIPDFSNFQNFSSFSNDVMQTPKFQEDQKFFEPEYFESPSEVMKRGKNGILNEISNFKIQVIDTCDDKIGGKYRKKSGSVEKKIEKNNFIQGKADRNCMVESFKGLDKVSLNVEDDGNEERVDVAPICRSSGYFYKNGKGRRISIEKSKLKVENSADKRLNENVIDNRRRMSNIRLRK